MKPFTPKFVKIAVLRVDGGTSIMSFCTLGRGHILPPGGLWIDSAAGIWARPDNDANINEEVGRSDVGSPMVSWQRITGNADLPADREYRNAVVCNNGKLEHDMAKARDCCRNLIREERANILPQLDAEWMRAQGQKKSAEADAIEAQRQKWRDAPADPRVEAATSVEELKQIKVE